MAKKKPAKDFMEVGKELVPGMRLRFMCRGHTGPIRRIAWSTNRAGPVPTGRILDRH